ncbi:MAG TPA: energy transducer TonB [Chitinispirillaceae bacterium]|nr:energy transducer TonB [Chitinispirillaceae bacterium]
MNRDSQEWLIQFYARADLQNKRPEQNRFSVIVICTLIVFFAIAVLLKSKNPPPETLQQKIDRIQTRFVFEQKKPLVKIEKEKPRPVKKPDTIEKKEPVDLTKVKPQEKLQKPPEQIEPEPEQAPKKPVRRVYGLKKVYSSGIGTSGDASSAIIGKQGNTLNTEIDTFKVTREELKGQVASIATVTTLPKLKFQVKPEYTKEMIEHHIEGVVRVKILIDIDGKVKQAIVLDDLGYGSKQKVYEACLKLEFEPALEGNVPRASWQLIKFRYELLQG